MRGYFETQNIRKKVKIVIKENNKKALKELGYYRNFDGLNLIETLRKMREEIVDFVSMIEAKLINLSSSAGYVSSSSQSMYNSENSG